jgi:hypothetical protein
MTTTPTTAVIWDDITSRYEVILNGQLIASYHCLDHFKAVKHLEALNAKNPRHP